jgi:hypothetical protein
VGQGSQISIQVEPDLAIAVARNSVVVPGLRSDGLVTQHVLVSIDLEESVDVNPSFLPPGGVKKLAEPEKKVKSLESGCLTFVLENINSTSMGQWKI